MKKRSVVNFFRFRLDVRTMIIVILLSLVGIAFGADVVVDVCGLKSIEKRNPSEFCHVGNCDRTEGNCCWKDGFITIDLRQCNIADLTANEFLQSPSLTNQTGLITRICLDNNEFGPQNVSADAFRGLTGLELLTLPRTFHECPGGNGYWNMSVHNDTLQLCENQHQPCNISHGVCPEKSHCVNDGPGLMRCKCNDGYYGYKCLKSGQFPFAAFYGSLGAATVVISAVLWFIGRRKIGLHTKQS